MKSRLINYCFAFIVLFSAFSCSEDEDIPDIPNEVTVTDEILNLVNAHRQSIGLSSLQTNDTAEQLAIDHSKYMIRQGRISHYNFGSRSNKLGEEENARSSAENVASGQNSAQSVMTSWLNSSGHKANIEGNFTHIGIAALKDENGRYYYTQLFYR